MGSTWKASESTSTNRFSYEEKSLNFGFGGGGGGGDCLGRGEVCKANEESDNCGR